MGKLTEALAHLRETTDKAITFADPTRAIAEAQDKFHEAIAAALDAGGDASAIEERVHEFREHVVGAIEGLADRVSKLEKAALTPAEVPPPAPPAPAPAPEAAAAAPAAVNAAPTGEEIAAAALAAASGQAT